MPALTAAMSSVPASRNTVDLTDLVAASDDTGDGAFNVAAATLEFDLIECHTESARADAFSITSIVKVDISEAKIISLGADRAATGTDGPAFHATYIAAIAMIAIAAIMPARIVAVRPVSAVSEIEVQAAIVGLNRNRAIDARARFALVGERRRSEEQRRRKGKRGCSRFHDAFHHGCRNTYAISTEPEQAIRLAFIKFRRCPFLAILS